MKKIINVVSSLEGIGLDFYSDEDIKNFKNIKNELAKNNIKVDETKVHWDIENNKLSYPDDKANKVLKNVYVNLLH